MNTEAEQRTRATQERRERATARLLDGQDPNATGYWRVYAEAGDGGVSYSEDLGYFVGQYAKVVDYVTKLDSFYTYGWGGRINPSVGPMITYV